MPIYEYYCAKCDAEFESMLPVSQMDEPAPCDTCGQPGQRLLSNFSFKSNSFTAPKLKPVKRKPFRSHNITRPVPRHQRKTPGKGLLPVGRVQTGGPPASALAALH